MMTAASVRGKRTGRHATGSAIATAAMTRAARAAIIDPQESMA